MQADALFSFIVEKLIKLNKASKAQVADPWFRLKGQNINLKIQFSVGTGSFVLMHGPQRYSSDFSEISIWQTSLLCAHQGGLFFCISFTKSYLEQFKRSLDFGTFIFPGELTLKMSECSCTTCVYVLLETKRRKCPFDSNTIS